MIFKINNVSVAFPSKFEVLYSDLDGETYRNAKGKTIRDRIRGGDDAIRKLNLAWNKLNDSELKTLLQSVKNESFTVEYYDPYEGKQSTRNFYVGDRTVPAYSLVNGKQTWVNAAFNLVEV